MFIGSCRWLWNDCLSPSVPGGEDMPAFPTALGVQGFGFHTPESLSGLQQQLFPNLEVQACPRSCSTCERHSLRVQHPLCFGTGWTLRAQPHRGNPCGTAGAGHAVGLVWGWGCASSGSGGHHSNPSLGWPICEFQMCPGVKWVQQRESGGSGAASQQDFSGFVSSPRF